MPLHKSGRAPRLDPTMISAPLGDFRHTMHVGRGGDAFGDTSFLSSHGPAKPESPATTESFSSVTPPEPASNDNTDSRANHNFENKPPDEPLPTLQHSESVSSFDLDLDLGPSILGDVLGVMDGLGLGAKWTTGNEADEDVFGSNKNRAEEGVFVMGATHELYEKRTESLTREEEHLNDVNDVKSKGLRPKVRFSDKKEEIVGRQYVVSASEEEQEKETQMRADRMGMKEAVKSDSTNHHGHDSPSPSSSMSSEYEGISGHPLDRRREDDHVSESGSEEDGVSGEQGYTFEDESDDEIGL